ncbi:MAG: DivIVA domain-containing protein [Firmicutes bacterium]|nr:DivIVA domain-containing protein [Bacillota bacterium]
MAKGTGRAFESEKRGYRVSDVDRYIAESNKTHADLKDRVAELTKQLVEKDAELKAFSQKQDLIVKSIMAAAAKAEQIENLIRQRYTGELAHLTAFHEVWTAYYKRVLEKYPLSEDLAGLNRFNKKLDEILAGSDSAKGKFEKAHEQFESESERLNRQKKKYVGFIPVDGVADGGVGLGMGGDGMDLSDFNPEENIRQLLRRQAAEEEQRQRDQGSGKGHEQAGERRTSFGKGKKPPVAATVNVKDLGESDSGFSFEEALNPTQKLSDILKEIGINLMGEDEE